MSKNPADPTGCAPIFVVRDVAASLAFYVERLGFAEAFRWGEPLFYAGVFRGEVELHLHGASHADAPAGAASLSVFVGDADATHDELVGRGVAIEVAIDDRPYGLRDFSVRDPDGNRLVFGSPTGR